MQVAIQQGTSRNRIPFDPASLRWKRQASEFALDVPTGLSKPTNMFVKRGPQAPGHLLWIAAATDRVRLPATPEPFGYARDKTGHYYFAEMLPRHYATLEAELSRTPLNDPTAARRWLEKLLIERQTGERVCQRAAEFFQAVLEEGFIYPDFCAKNIMVDRRPAVQSDRPCLFIDLDSCFASDALATTPDGLKTYSGKFSMSYWYAWHRGLGTMTPEALHQAMLLAFCGTWARGLTLLKAGSEPTEIVKLLRNPTSAQQEPLWNALAQDNRQAFGRYFGLAIGPETDRLWNRWREATDSIKAGALPNWQTIETLVSLSFATVRDHGGKRFAMPKAKPAIGAKPVASNEPPISLEGILFGADPSLSRGGYALRLALAIVLTTILSILLSDTQHGLGSAYSLIGFTCYWGAISIKRARYLPGRVYPSIILLSMFVGAIIFALLDTFGNIYLGEGGLAATGLLWIISVFGIMTSSVFYSIKK